MRGKSYRSRPGFGAFLHLDPRQLCQKILGDGEVVSIHAGAVDAPHSKLLHSHVSARVCLALRVAIRCCSSLLKIAISGHAEPSLGIKELSRLAVRKTSFFQAADVRHGVGFLHRSLLSQPIPSETLYRSFHGSQSHSSLLLCRFRIRNKAARFFA